MFEVCSLISFICHRPQTKLWEGNAFTAVCDSVHRRGCLPVVPGVVWVDTPMQTPLAGPLGRHPLDTLWVDTH